MRNLPEFPQQKELLKKYNLFQSGKGSSHEFIKSLSWCRMDPRLGEILIIYLRDHWSEWNATELSTLVAKLPWPWVFGVLCSHVELILNKSDLKTFRLWRDCALSKIEKNMEYSVFFIGVYSFAGKQMKSEVIESLSLYSRWGYYGQTPMIPLRSSEKEVDKTLISKHQRKAKLLELFQMKRRISVSDYLEFLDQKVSKRIGENDLKTWARKSGNTKGTTYTLGKHKK